jgi:hypothetical protein
MMLSESGNSRHASSHARKWSVENHVLARSGL